MLKRMSVVFCGLALVMMTAGVAAAQDTAVAKTKAAAKKTGDATENVAKKTAKVVTDAEITTAVKTKLLADTKVSGSDVSVDTTNHVVTLTGTVKSAAEKAEAIRVTKKTAGVHKVVSKGLKVDTKKK
jgi:hyperosmotically inducible periplasmic protein